jgi:type III pantothenate kinase
MTPDVVVDVGNTRIKWGLCQAGKVAAVASLPADSPAQWADQIRTWKLAPHSTWVATGVHPARREALIEWLGSRGHRALVLKDWAQLPIQVELAHPECVGIDRLLDAVAARSQQEAQKPAVIVDAGTAVTVDWLDATGAFRGGAIFPGLRLMAESLHNFTAQLPLIEITAREPALPGWDTRSAMEGGIFWTVVAGIELIIYRLARFQQAEPDIFLTGGDAERLSLCISRHHKVWPEMTLEGVRLAAEALS